jgi:glutaredoxin
MSDKQVRVFFYSKPGCPYCMNLENDLIGSKILFKKHVVKDIIEAAEIKDRLKHNSFPIVFVDGKKIGGYSEFVANAEKLNIDF